MKKFVACTFCIALVVLFVFHLTGGGDFATDNLTHVNEASFGAAMENGTESTSFLVGSFAATDGSSLSFNGTGSVTSQSSGGIAKSGQCVLVQYEDGSAVIQFQFPDGTEAYTFELVAANGSFSLTDEEGSTVIYAPYLA